jgi:H/ACA ribonucleoprotein complex subunit 1
LCVSAEVSAFLHSCEGDAVTKLTNEKVPYFNAPIYLQNKTQIGKVDEIFGPINESVSASLTISLRHRMALFG